jgi:hypothetical protein
MRSEAPRGCNREIILPEMDPVGPNGQSDVDAVVDDQEHPGPGRFLTKSLGTPVQRQRGAFLVPQLNDSRPTVNDSPQYIQVGSSR